ncbi:HD-GYP domain-containing protein [Bradyrhizobium sp. 2TAF24]|uniref:HD-GYP domain-containing protein n=1 Tax=Bradyrhizobium sp. 2TAF24 TaxID=3233011 RepID=UPI003F902173
MSLVDGSLGRRYLLLASDRGDRSSELARIMSVVGNVDVVSTADMPEKPLKSLSGIVVDIDLRSTESVQRVRRKLVAKAYQSMPRLFVLADTLHHGSTQAWALGATDTIQRPFEADAVLRRLNASFAYTQEKEETSASREALSRGVAAAHAVLVRVFEKLRAGVPLTPDDVMQEETRILKALKRSSLKEWVLAVRRHHNRSYRHCLLVTGFAVAFGQHLGMREEDQRRLARAGLIHDVGKAFIPLSILNKADALTDDEDAVMREHTRRGYDALAAQASFPREMLDVVLHHHELLDGTGYPDQLRNGDISDIVRIITMVDVFAALVERSGQDTSLSREAAFGTLEHMGDKLDQQLVQAFRPVAFGS